MGVRFLLAAVLLVAFTARAQQSGSADSGAAKSQTNSPGQTPATKPASSTASQSGSSASPTQSNTPPTSPNQPPADGLSRDLTFPGDRPAQPSPPSSPSSGSAQQEPDLTPPRSDRVRVGDLDNTVGESSSKDTQVDLSPPANDDKAHPQSSTAVATVADSGITEFHTWDPHKAAKSVEVGDFYFRRKNYRAAEDRYREALRYKDNDAVATIRLAASLEKLGELDDARAEYESYLRILPHGPQAEEAQKAINRLKASQAAGETK